MKLITSIFQGILEITIPSMVVVKSDDWNQGHIRCYWQGNVQGGFSKTEISAPPNENYGNNNSKNS